MQQIEQHAAMEPQAVGAGLIIEGENLAAPYCAAIEPGDAQALAETLARVSTGDGLAAIGLRGRNMLDTHFTRRAALERWRGVLEGIEG